MKCLWIALLCSMVNVNAAWIRKSHRTGCFIKTFTSCIVPCSANNSEFESSCDETAASVAEDYTKIRSNVVASQVKEHQLYGGVVPEIASRRHCENVLPVVQKALDDAQVTLADLDGIAVTYAPGLIGALLVGVNFAKGLALATGKPLVPVHHLAGHIAANYIAHPELKPPYLCLVASGGHSHIVEVLSYTEFRIVGRTRDDAAGECFDKTARAMEMYILKNN